MPLNLAVLVRVEVEQQIIEVRFAEDVAQGGLHLLAAEPAVAVEVQLGEGLLQAGIEVYG